MRLYHSEEDLFERLVKETLSVAERAGFNTVEQDGKHTIAGKQGTDETVTVFPDGSWMYEGAASSYMTGRQAAELGLFLADPETYIATMDED